MCVPEGKPQERALEDAVAPRLAARAEATDHNLGGRVFKPAAGTAQKLVVQALLRHQLEGPGNVQAVEPEHVASFKRKQPAADIDRQGVLVTPAFAINVLVRTEGASQL